MRDLFSEMDELPNLKFVGREELPLHLWDNPEHLQWNARMIANKKGVSLSSELGYFAMSNGKNVIVQVYILKHEKETT